MLFILMTMDTQLSTLIRLSMVGFRLGFPIQNWRENEAGNCRKSTQGRDTIIYAGTVAVTFGEGTTIPLKW